MTNSNEFPVGRDSYSIFSRRFEVLLYAVRATEPLTASIVTDGVVKACRPAIRGCLNDLVEYGLLAKISTTKYVATDFAKELMGVNPTAQQPDLFSEAAA